MLHTMNSALSESNNNSNSQDRNQVSSGGVSKEIYICKLPLSTRRMLCEHLDDLDVWNQLATIMSLRPSDIQTVRRQQNLGNSPNEELLKIWGDQYNHTTTELFIVLQRQKLYPAMRIIIDFVDRKYHVLIPNSRPNLSELMPSLNENSNDQKLLNRSTSGVGHSHNVIDTCDNNFSSNSGYTSTTTSRNTTDSEEQLYQEQKQQHSIFLIKRNVKEFASCILEINYHELTNATNNWNEKFILGRGGFGTVYRGKWKHTEVAIKQIHYRGPSEHESVKVQLQQSLNELKYLNSCRHDNVLPIYGYSIKGEKPCLVYQLMTGGSLEERLKRRSMALTWKQRINICLGTARGINYLHVFRDKPLIHGDIKPANVLLDQCLQPKIGDFGLAREGPNAINSAVEVTQVFGTKPYLPPEFLNSKKLSTQVDTYSFGVVLLETFTGLRVYERNRKHPLLTKHVISFCSEPNNKIEDLIDDKVPLLPGEQGMCKRMIELSLLCIADSPHSRPEMEQVLNTIDSFYTDSHFIR